MKLIKKINNNYALARDKNDELVIVNGLGIGFGAFPREVDDDTPTKVYRNIDQSYLDRLSGISVDVLKVAEETVRYAYKVMPKQKFSSKFVFILADHIDFTITRYKNGLVYDFAKYYDFAGLYDAEIKVADYCMACIEKYLNFTLPKEERGGFVANILNSEYGRSSEIEARNSQIIDKVIEIIESDFGTEFDKTSYTFTRFAVHMVYLFRRMREKTETTDIKVDNEMYEKMKALYPDIDACAKKIAAYLKTEFATDVDDDELLYLIIYINRLYA